MDSLNDGPVGAEACVERVLCVWTFSEFLTFLFSCSDGAPIEGDSMDSVNAIWRTVISAAKKVEMDIGPNPEMGTTAK